MRIKFVKKNQVVVYKDLIDGLYKNLTGRYYSNGIAEAINNNTQTLRKVSYGYHSFERFRKRCMLISRYKKI